MRKLILALALITGLGAAPPSPRNLVDDVERSLVKIQYQMTGEDGKEKTYVCTGMVTDAAKGEVLTARHCLGDKGEQMYVDGEESQVLKQDEAFALLSITPMKKPPVQIRKGLPSVGEVTTSFGYGFGNMFVLWRHVARLENGHVLMDGPLLSGMSGGPTVDAEGKVVGVNQASSEALGVACGTDEIRDFLKQKRP
jgi:S1-C subfamily serine protease